MAILIKNIKELIQVEEKPQPMVAGKAMSKLTTLKNAWLLIEGDRIKDFGEMTNYQLPITNYQLPIKEEATQNAKRSTQNAERSTQNAKRSTQNAERSTQNAERSTQNAKRSTQNAERSTQNAERLEVIDATGKMVFPSFCDSHTHLVYAGSREVEYIDKIKGLSYEEIARRGGGILNSARRLHDATEDELVEQALGRLNEIMMLGTGAVEIKSGYGLSVEDELKMLRVIRKLKKLTPVTVVPTFLGAHAVPTEFKGRQGDFVDLVISEMIPMVAAEELADYIDVFCDRGFFTVEETDRILNAGMKHGMRAKIHANELDYSGGIQVGVKYNALSVDHLEFTGDAEIEFLVGTETMPTVLPGAAFFLEMAYAPVRKMISAGLPVAMASDFNPGSSPSGNMQFILSMACIKYRMLPEEAIHAVTINSAYAMGLSGDYGSIARAKKANLFITKPIPTYSFMPYAYGSNKVETVILNGMVISPSI